MTFRTTLVSIECQAIRHKQQASSTCGSSAVVEVKNAKMQVEFLKGLYKTYRWQGKSTERKHTGREKQIEVGQGVFAVRDLGMCILE